MVKQITLTKGMVAIVDDDWYDMLNLVKWQACSVKKGKAYAGRGFRKADGTHGGELMSRVIMGATKTDCVDHKNGDTLDNRKENLRLCSHSQNAMNRTRKRLRSRFKGVAPKGKGWCAYIFVNNKQMHLGVFATEEEAAQAYDESAKRHFGAFCRLNFPSHSDRKESA